MFQIQQLSCFGKGVVFVFLIKKKNMKNLILLNAFLFGITSPIFAKHKSPNLYIDIHKKYIEIGTYKKNRVAKLKYKKYDIDSIDIDEAKSFLIQQEDKSVLFYFHSLYGSITPYHKHSIKKLSRINQFKKIISIEWHGNDIRYKHLWNEAPQKGSSIRTLMAVLFSVEGLQKNVLSHSMGNRVFEGIIANLDSVNYHLNTVIFVAADLDSDVFEKSLKQLTRNTAKIVIYIHKKDRLLKLSKWIHGRKRLGRDGISSNKQKDTIEVIDVTSSSSQRLIRLSNHIYFKLDKNVGKDIAALLANDRYKREKWLSNSSNGIYILK